MSLAEKLTFHPSHWVSETEHEDEEHLEMCCIDHPDFFAAFPHGEVTLKRLLEEVQLHLLTSHKGDGLTLNRAQRFAAQATHIREHQAEWDKLQGENCDIEGYLADYGSYERWDLYQRICEDLGIKPKPKICHPNPED